MRKQPQSIFGHRLRLAREAAGIPQDRLGVMIGIDEGCSSARVSRYETGTHQPPFEIAEKLASVLNIPVEFLYCRSDQLGDLLLLIADFPDDELNRLKRAAERIKRGREK